MRAGVDHRCPAATPSNSDFDIQASMYPMTTALLQRVQMNDLYVDGINFRYPVAGEGPVTIANAGRMGVLKKSICGSEAGPREKLPLATTRRLQSARSGGSGNHLRCCRLSRRPVVSSLAVPTCPGGPMPLPRRLAAFSTLWAMAAVNPSQGFVCL